MLLQLTVRDALTTALDEEMTRDPAVYILGEEVGYIIHSCRQALVGHSTQAGCNPHRQQLLQLLSSRRCKDSLHVQQAWSAMYTL